MASILTGCALEMKPAAREFFQTDLLKVAGCSKSLDVRQIDCLVLDTVDVLEAELGETALEGI